MTSLLSMKEKFMAEFCTPYGTTEVHAPARKVLEFITTHHKGLIELCESMQGLNSLLSRDAALDQIINLLKE